MNKRDFDPEDFQIHRGKDEDVDAGAAIDSMCFGATRRQYYREEVGSVIKGPGLPLVTEARMSISQVDCKGYTR